MNEWLRFRRPEGRDPADRDFSDARSVERAARQRELDPELRRRVKLRRRALVLGLSAACVAGSLVAFVGKGGYHDMLRLRSEIEELQADVLERQTTIERLEREVAGLEHDPMARERVAREQLGLVLPGEVDFLLPRERTLPWEAPTGAVRRQP